MLLLLTRRVPKAQREKEKEGSTAWRILHKAVTIAVAEATFPAAPTLGH